MGRKLSTLLLAAGLAGVSFVPRAQAGDQPDNPPARDAVGPLGVSDGGGPPPGGPRRPGGFHLLPPRADEQLDLTADQRKQLDDLEVDVKARIDKILTPEQREKLERMRPTARRGPGGEGPESPGADRPRPPAPSPSQEGGDAKEQSAAGHADLPKDAVAVTFTGGYETEEQDHGRPVVLIAAALNVPSEVFRKAFSNVKPAAGGQQPEPAQVRKNKETLLRSLGPYGITNELLDTVSNYYRYSGSRGEMWRHTPATAYATIHNGVMTGFTITNPGAGYSSPPKVSVAGLPNLTATATLSFGTDFKTNGSIKEITAATAK